jgi:molybdenum cofactor cytidylyltransferase
VNSPQIGAVVLAAGESTRMGKPKMALPWGDTTVIGQVVNILSRAGIGEILVVTGGAHRQVQEALHNSPAKEVYNPHFQQGEMLSSLKLGLTALGPHIDAALVALGDHPQVETGVVKALVKAYEKQRSPLVVPSYQMRRGHPWLLDRSLWPLVLALKEPDTLRDLLNTHQDSIHYVVVDTPTILQDLDTPGDYQKYSPG